MAFRKGNSNFPGSSFVVDELSRVWNHSGVIAPQPTAPDLVKTNGLNVTYYKLLNMAIINVSGTIVPSTIPHTGVEDSTAYLYTGPNVLTNIPTSVTFSLGSTIRSSSDVFTSSCDIRDSQSKLYFAPYQLTRDGFTQVHTDNNNTYLQIFCPTGFLPHHNYALSSTIVLSCV